jgi:hypothetical protein
MAERQHVVQQQGRALARGQPLQRGDEGQADILPPDHLVLRIPAQVGVADRLDPGQLGIGRPRHRAGVISK